MYTIVLGPLVWISFSVFVLGSALQVWRFYRLSRKAVPSHHVPSLPPQKKKATTLLATITVFLQQAKFTVLAIHPLTITISTLFHVCLVMVPLFLLGHNELVELAFGVSLPSIPEQVADGLTVIVLMCCAYFLGRRLLLARMRAITSLADYLVLGLAIVPFLSGFMAFHQIYDYRTVMVVHMLSGELMLMAIPFTKLTHMIFFFFNRFLIVNEHTIVNGSRIW